MDAIVSHFIEMHTTRFLFITLGLTLFLCACGTEQHQTEQSELPPEETTFFDQTPPGKTPELFAPGIVSTNALEIELAIAPDMQTFYFVRQLKGEPPKAHLMEYVNGTWEETIFDRFDGEVFVSTDNQTLYLGNTYKVRTDTGWSAEQSLGPEYDEYPIMRLTASSAGTYVFDVRDTMGTLRYSRINGEVRDAPKAFGAVINTGTWIAHPFIAPDESYLIWDATRPEGNGDSDLYISFRAEDGSWGPAINMGPDINNHQDNSYGSVSSDGKYFFFHTVDLSEGDGVANIFWVDAGVITTLRNQQVAP